jgi:hypothetical protein
MPRGRPRMYSGPLESGTTSVKTRLSAKTRASGNAAVKRVYRRKAVVPKTKVDTNKSAIATLAKQVRSLQLRNIGQFQKNWEHCAVVGGNTAWHAQQPVIFAMNNFIHEAPIYQGKADSTSFPGKTVPGYIVKTNWAHTDPYSAYTDYSYWQGANDDVANPKSYQPIATTITFNFEAPALPPNSIYWVRMDIIKPKKVLLHSNVHKLGLPMNVQSLSDLVNDDMLKRNRINRQYFDVIKTKFIKMTNTKNSDTTIEKFYKYTHKFPQSFSYPTRTLGAGETIHTPTGEITDTFVSNMPQDKIVWCMLSCSFDGQLDQSNILNVQMSRYISYRDNEGVAT